MSRQYIYVLLATSLVHSEASQSSASPGGVSSGPPGGEASGTSGSGGSGQSSDNNPVSEMLSIAREAVDEGTKLLKRVFDPMNKEVRSSLIKLLQDRYDNITTHKRGVDERINSLPDSSMARLRKWLLSQMTKVQENMLDSLSWAINMLKRKEEGLPVSTPAYKMF